MTGSFSEQIQQLTPYITALCPKYFPACYYHQITFFMDPVTLQPESLTQQPFGTITIDSPPECALARNNTHTQPVSRRPEPHNH
jgi:hypothetical protein